MKEYDSVFYAVDKNILLITDITVLMRYMLL